MRRINSMIMHSKRTHWTFGTIHSNLWPLWLTNPIIKDSSVALDREMFRGKKNNQPFFSSLFLIYLIFSPNFLRIFNYSTSRLIREQRISKMENVKITYLYGWATNIIKSTDRFRYIDNYQLTQSSLLYSSSSLNLVERNVLPRSKCLIANLWSEICWQSRYTIKNDLN